MLITVVGTWTLSVYPYATGDTMCSNDSTALRFCSPEETCFVGPEMTGAR